MEIAMPDADFLFRTYHGSVADIGDPDFVHGHEFRILRSEVVGGRLDKLRSIEFSKIIKGNGMLSGQELAVSAKFGIDDVTVHQEVEVISLQFFQFYRSGIAVFATRIDMLDPVSKEMFLD